MKKIAPSPQENNRAIVLLAILLAFVALLVFIWLWYDLRLKQIEKGVSLNATSSGFVASAATSKGGGDCQLYTGFKTRIEF